MRRTGIEPPAGPAHGCGSILVPSLIPLVPLEICFRIADTAVALTVPVVLVAVLSLSRSSKILGTRMRELSARLRAPMIATEAMDVPVVALRLTLVPLLPARVPFLFKPNGVSEVTIVLVAGVSAGIALYFAFLRLFDLGMSDGLRRLWVQMIRDHRD